MTDRLATKSRTQKNREVLYPKRSVGSANKPLIQWIGGRRGYLWIGDDEPDPRWLSCFATLTTGEARKLRDILIEADLG